MECSSRRVRITWTLTAALLAAGCQESPVDVPPPQLEIVDAVHDGGSANFYFLPPLVDAPSVQGEFDATADPSVRICRLTGGVCATPPVVEFTMTSGTGSETVRVDVDAQHYIVNWHTKRFSLDPRETYRIVVADGGVELGHADVDVVSSGKELKSVDTGHFVPLKNGRTLPINFRIETPRIGLPPVLVTSDRTGNLEIFAIRPDGTGAVNLTAHPSNDAEGSWSPDGRRVVFTSTRDGQADLYLLNVVGGGVTRLTNTPERERTPSFSPDGSQVLFDIFRSTGSGDIYVIGADGSGLTQLTQSAQEDRAPSWSPDGTSVAFHKQTPANTDVWIMNEDGSGPRNVTNSPLIFNSVAAWVPGGSSFFTAAGPSGSGSFALLRIDVATGAATQITPLVSGRRDVNPVLAPDGRSLLFTSNRAVPASPSEVFLLDLASGAVTQITDEAGFTSVSDWFGGS